jgi:hypothetical protein
MVYVAIAPPETLEVNLTKKAAAIIGKDLYEAHLLLSGKIPRIIAHYDTMQMAEFTAQNLRALGLVAIVCSDSELRKPSPIHRAQTLRFEERAVLFRDKRGQARRMKAKNMFLILKGTIQSYAEKATIKTRMKFNLLATVMTGGIPIWRRVKEKTREMSTQTECFVRLYDRSSTAPAMEILQHSFDYSCLGTKMASSSVTNLDILLTGLRNTFSQATFDDRLTEPCGADIPFTSPRENIEIKCKLIYFYHQAMSDLGSSV